MKIRGIFTTNNNVVVTQMVIIYDIIKVNIYAFGAFNAGVQISKYLIFLNMKNHFKKYHINTLHDEPFLRVR